MSEIRFLGRYAMHDELASGGMATIHLGRLLGPVGFARTVAIKRMHPQFAKDPQFVAMFVDEARLAARIRHQNVVPTLDVVALEGEIFLVMEYVHGESVSRLMAALDARKERVPPAIAASIVIDVLHGLQAAHDAKNEKGVPLEIVHRDVSPQNVLVGVDGIARVLDFGVAKAVDRLQTTGDGNVKGKMGYAAPEQVEGAPVDRRTDVWSAAVVFWEMLTGRRLFGGRNAAASLHAVLTQVVKAPSEIGGTPPELDAVVLRGVARDPEERFPTAREMAVAIEAVITPASARAIGEWAESTARETLASRAARVEEMESAGGGSRSSDGSLRRQLAVLGFPRQATDAKASAPPPSSEEPTGQAPGRVRQSDAPAPPSVAASAPPAPEREEDKVVAPPAPAQPRSLFGPATLAAAALAVAAAAIVVGGRDAPPAPLPSAPSRSSATSASSTTPSTTASVAAASTPRPVLDAESPAALVAPAATTSVRIARPRPAVPDASRPKVDCDPPYTVGPAPECVRVPKAECLPP